jgi:hypothetical protein
MESNVAYALQRGEKRTGRSDTLISMKVGHQIAAVLCGASLSNKKPKLAIKFKSQSEGELYIDGVPHRMQCVKETDSITECYRVDRTSSIPGLTLHGEVQNRFVVIGSTVKLPSSEKIIRPTSKIENFPMKTQEKTTSGIVDSSIDKRSSAIKLRPPSTEISSKQMRMKADTSSTSPRATTAATTATTAAASAASAASAATSSTGRKTSTGPAVDQLTEEWIVLLGIPISLSAHEIGQFFNGLEIKEIYATCEEEVVDSYRESGWSLQCEVYMRMHSKADATLALQRHEEAITPNCVANISRVTKWESLWVKAYGVDWSHRIFSDEVAFVQHLDLMRKYSVISSPNRKAISRFLEIIEDLCLQSDADNIYSTFTRSADRKEKQSRRTRLCALAKFGSANSLTTAISNHTAHSRLGVTTPNRFGTDFTYHNTKMHEGEASREQIKSTGYDRLLIELQISTDALRLLIADSTNAIVANVCTPRGDMPGKPAIDTYLQKCIKSVEEDMSKSEPNAEIRKPDEKIVLDQAWRMLALHDEILRHLRRDRIMRH